MTARPPRPPRVGDVVLFTEDCPEVYGPAWTGPVEVVRDDGTVLIRHDTGMAVGQAPYDPAGKPGTWRYPDPEATP